MVVLDVWDFNYDFLGVGLYEGIMVVNLGFLECIDIFFVCVNIFLDLSSDFSFVYDICVVEFVIFNNLSIIVGGQVIVSN